MKVKLWLDGLGRGNHCMGDDETTKDLYDRTSGEWEDVIEERVRTSAFRRENDLLRAVQVGVETFDIQESGHLNWIYPLVVHVAGKSRREKLGRRLLGRNTEVVHISEHGCPREHHGGHHASRVDRAFRQR